MKKINSIISSVLAFAFILGALVGVLPVISISAEAATPFLGDYESGGQASEYLNQTYSSAMEKIEYDPYMQLCAETDKYEMYFNRYSGEVYLREKGTDNVMTTNPYYIGAHDSDTIPMELLSQLIITFTDTTGAATTYTSYEWAAVRNQIFPTAIKNGLRLDYTIGDTTTRYLVPNGISAERFQSVILAPAQQYIVEYFRTLVLNFLEARVGDDGEIIYENNDKLEKVQEILTHADGGWVSGEYYRPGKAIYKYVLNENWYDLDFVVNFMTNYESVVDESGNVIFEGYGIYGDHQKFNEWYEAVYDYFKIITNKVTNEYKGNIIEFGKMRNGISDYLTLNELYSCKDPSGMTEGAKELLAKSWPGIVSGKDENGDPIYRAIYVLDTEGATNKKKRELQATILKYAPEYTFDDMLADEADTKLEPEIEVNPVFRMTMEYVITEGGMEISLPASSITYDETLYTITDIKVLPYFGSTAMVAGDKVSDGYIFYPDGSGAIVEYSDFYNKNLTITNTIYGNDYTFHSITGSNEETIKMPVYGSVYSNAVYSLVVNDPDSFLNGKTLYYTEQMIPADGVYNYEIRAEYFEIETGEKDNDGNPIKEKYYEFYYENVSGMVVPLPKEDGKQYIEANGSRRYFDKKLSLSDNAALIGEKFLSGSVDLLDGSRSFNGSDTGYFAIIEDGASMCDLSVIFNGDAGNKFASVYPSFVNIPVDSYSLGVLGEAGTTMFTVVSDTRYQGDLVLNMHLLTDRDDAAADCDSYADYNGMANIYRDYILETAGGALSYADHETLSQLPLYIETFGVMETIKKFLTFPVTVKVPLTSYEDIKTIYNDLESIGIKNVKFKMTGYANGGMTATYPAKLKWEKAAGGKSGLKKLISFVSEKAGQGMEIFPEFEVSYIKYDRWFDGIRYQKAGSKTVDNRYASKHTYDPSTQTINMKESGGIIVSTGLLEKFYDKFNRKYKKLNIGNISLGSIGEDLSSDYNADEPFLREASMDNVLSYLSKVSQSYNIMTMGGNVYTLAYISHILDAPIDSSHYRFTSYTVPFYGMVMHGLVDYAGGAFNEEGNPDYTILRSIESGAALYFILSYQNTNLMKDDFVLNSYYSVNYNIWVNKDYVYDSEGNFMHKHTDGKFYTLTQSKRKYTYTVGGETFKVDEPEKYVTDGGDVKTYYDKLNGAIGNLQDFVISEHRYIPAERIVSETEILRNRATLEDEFITKLNSYVDTKRENSIAINNILYYRVYKPTLEYLNKTHGVTIASYDDFLTYLGQTSYDDIARAIKLANIKLDIEKVDPSYFTELGVDAATFNYSFFGLVAEEVISVNEAQALNFVFDTASLSELALDISFSPDATYVTDFAANLAAVVAEQGVEYIAGTSYGRNDIILDADSFSYISDYDLFTDSEALDPVYVSTDYTINDGSVTMVTYTKGTEKVTFILNYNMFDVKVVLNGVEHTIPSLQFDTIVGG